MTPDILDYQGKYGPIEPKVKPYRIVGFDTEDDSKGTPISFAFHDGVTPFYTRDADEALDYIYNVRETTVFVAHNLEYDLGNLMKGCDFKYIDEMIYASRLLSASLFGTKSFFLNSASFFAGSLAKLGELVGIPKLDGDPFDPEYNIRDAMIPQVFMERMQKRLNAMGINLGLSIGQLAMSVYRRKFLRSDIITFNRPDVLDSYYGGRVEVYYKGILRGPLHVTDINSSYPDVMRNNSYPDTARIERSRLDTHEFGYGKFTIHVPSTLFVPPLPFRAESGRLFFPTGRLEGTWTYAEVREAVKMGCRIIKETPGYGTNCRLDPYGEFIDYFYGEREVVKKALRETPPGQPKDPDLLFEDLFLKLIMNNRYGKDAQHKPGTLMTRVQMPASKLEKYKGFVERKVGPFWGYRLERDAPPKTANYLWGTYTTAYARLSLLRKAVAVHEAGSTLAYMDTDSIMFTGDAGLKVLDIGDGLGRMSVETYDLGIFRQAKGYLLCKEKAGEFIVEKVACKGVPTQHALSFIRDGMAMALKPLRLKEALIRTHAAANKDAGEEFLRDVGVNVWREVPKVMRGIYIKRKGENGVTYPVDVEEIPVLEALSAPAGESMDEMHGLPVKDKPRKADPFRNITIPPGWHRRSGNLDLAEEYFQAQKVQFLRREQLLEIGPGDTWFAGKSVRVEEGKFGKFYVFRLKTYLNRDVSRKNILAAIPQKFLEGVTEKNLSEGVGIILRSKYIKNRDAELTVRILKPKTKGQS